MMDEAIRSELNRFQHGTIRSLLVDVLACSVTVRTLEEEVSTEHTISFEEVVSIFYWAGQKSDRFRLGLPTDELSWILSDYYPKGAASVAPVSISDPWTELYQGRPNFGITLGGNGALLIEARRVIIDGHVYEVGYADPDWVPTS